MEDPTGWWKLLRSLDHADLFCDFGAELICPGHVFADSFRKFGEYLGITGDRWVLRSREAERIRQAATEADDLGHILFVSQHFVMAGSDVKKFPGPLPRCAH